jgi:glycosyltransferase involved in cell wall biosynthesis
VPLFSLVTPVFNPPMWALEECITSVLSQSFTDWEWCIADDASTDPNVLAVLKKLVARDSRVKLLQRETNGGIIAASNSALELVTGDFVALLDHDDSLSLHALLTVAEVIAANDTVDYIYSDEDKIDESGQHFDVFRKPSFSPERLRGQNYCCHLSVFRSSLIKEIDGFRKGFEGAQDYDLILRATEKARKIVHIPEVLYHWRVVSGSTAGDANAKPYTIESGRRAVAKHCERIGLNADVTSTTGGYVHVKRKVTQDKKISIIIPTRGDRKRIWGVDTCLVTNAIDSILEKSSYRNVEIVVVHDHVPHLDSRLQHHIDENRVSLVWYGKPFDFSDKCNIGVVHSSGDIVVLLNDDTEIESPDWLEVLVGFLEDDNVAIVGPLTVLEDGRVQSAGHGNNTLPHNLGAGDLIDSPGYFGERLISREISGVTGACLAMRRGCYFELGGMSTTLPHSFNDVDLAFKALDAGYRIIWTPLAKIYHFESLSRDPRVRPEELEQLSNRWETYFNRDSYTTHSE